MSKVVVPNYKADVFETSPRKASAISAGRAGAVAPVDQASRLRMMVESISSGNVSGPGSRPADPPIKSEIGTPPVIALTSGKGGVGKTSLSVNLAIALRQLGLRITLVDGDLGLANADVMCGVSPALRLDAVVSGRSMDSITIDAPGGIRLVPGCVGIARMADLGSQERTRLVKGLSTIAKQSDAVLLDTGAGINNSVLSLLAAADSVVVVMTPEPTSMTDAYALMKCLEQNRLNAQAYVSPALRRPLKLFVLVNQARDQDEAVRVHTRIASVCTRFLAIRPVFLGSIGFEPEVTHSIRRRRPLYLTHPRLKWSKQLEVVASALADAAIPCAAGRGMLKTERNSSPASGLRSIIASLLGH